MLIARMVDDQIHDDFDACRMGFFQQFREVGHRPEIGMDILVIGDVVAVVDVRRSVDGVQPDEIDAQRLQIGQFFDDALQIADAVVVGIAETPRVNLIAYRIFPPSVHAVTFTTKACHGSSCRSFRSLSAIP